MLPWLPRLVGVVVLTLSAVRAAETVIRLETPAQRFTESSPLGNGRLGAMLFGGVDVERIVLNESGMWSGSPQDADRPEAAAALPEIRRLLLAGDHAAAEKLVNEHFTCAGPGSGRGRGANVPFGSYQVLADLGLTFAPATENAVTGYRRELDLATATTRLTYTRDGVTYRREAFVSAPDNVFVLRLTADRAGALSFAVALTRPERAETETVGHDTLRLTGGLSDGRGGIGVRFATLVRVRATGGAVGAAGGRIEVRGADAVELLVTAATDIKTFAGRGVTDARAAVERDLTQAETRGWAALRAAHEADYRAWFERVTLELGGTSAATAALATPERLAAFGAGRSDPGLAALYFNFGRYLLISSSRPGGLPANLQGIWADGINTPWNGDWHLNINVQMNYWLAEVGNLAELHTPLFALIESLRTPGARTARNYYGARGWVAHVITNPWGFTSPGESASWGATSSGSAWLCTHLWEHYLFGRDREFLRRIYPTLKESAQFYQDMLIAEPSHGWLVTAPSNSPENAFKLPDGSAAHICLGATMDQQLVRALFLATATAARELGIEPEFAAALDAARARLAPTRVGPDGRVLEWLAPYEEVDPHHRHVSHLWGLYPGQEIDARSDPALAAAARRTLLVRGDAGTGWGTAFKLGMWARLGDGERAYALLREHLQPARPTEKVGQWTGGIYPNLFGAHPPFQIDGNLGGPAVIAELLVQSRSAVGRGEVAVERGRPQSEIVLLPALPSAWPDGQVRGLRTRGGFEVDLAWAGGELTSAVVRSTGGTTAEVRWRDEVQMVTLERGREVKLVFPARTQGGKS